MDFLTVGSLVTNGTYIGKVWRVLDRFTVAVAWGPEMDNPDASMTVERSVCLTVIPKLDE